MNLNALAKEIHENAVAHGWWEGERNFAEIVALCHSELSEALEEDRAGRPMVWYGCHALKQTDLMCEPEGPNCQNNWRECELRIKKPEGIAVEMADCLIRILDWFGKERLDVEQIVRDKHEYNKNRPYKHGKRF